MKSVLIGLFLPTGASVLDLAGGKGGDLSKWKHGGISHLVLADIAHGSVQHALDRYRERHSHQFPALFVSGDAFGRPLFPSLDAGLRFQFVSCQFAFHYAFESEARLRATLQNVSERLDPGCHFVGTAPNAYRLVHLLRASRSLSWSNSICGFQFDEALSDKDVLPEFGARYTFSLSDAVDAVPEYLVHFAVLERVARDFNLELVLREEFPDFYKRHVEEHEGLLKRMEGDVLSEDEWQAASLYVCFCFRKKGHFKPLATGRKKQTFNHDYAAILKIQ